MARIELCGLTKAYGKTVALKEINLDIKDKEFFVLFGPAGAGKTTLLKMIAGIEYPDSGIVKINGEIVNQVESSKRNMAMVFENYALYPHLTVYDNIASPMRSKLYRKSEDVIKQKINKVALTMKIDQLLHRLPYQLSNGQRQRVALGRCLVREPNAFLMDEPLAHLDAKLRHFMRTELKSLQASLDTTVIYVTHDYLEALGLSDRLAIINNGSIEQLGTSREIYYSPANEFVARLVGEPEINFFPGRVNRCGGQISIDVPGMKNELPVQDDVAQVLRSRDSVDVKIGLRGHNIRYNREKNAQEDVETTVYSIEPAGNKAVLILERNEKLIRITVPNMFRVEIGQPIFINISMDDAIFFDAETGEFITRHNLDQILKGA